MSHQALGYSVPSPISPSLETHRNDEFIPTPMSKSEYPSSCTIDLLPTMSHQVLAPPIVEANESITTPSRTTSDTSHASAPAFPENTFLDSSDLPAIPHLTPALECADVWDDVVYLEEPNITLEELSTMTEDALREHVQRRLRHVSSYLLLCAGGKVLMVVGGKCWIP
jgi:hypothetical protein